VAPREWARRVSPVRRIELVVGKIVPYIAIGYLQMTIVLCVGKLVFDVPLVGSLPLLYALADIQTIHHQIDVARLTVIEIDFFR